MTIYQKASGTWSKKGNIKGATGEKGDPGSAGAKGDTGAKELLERGEANGTVGQRLLGQAQQELFLAGAESQMHL
mgnify:CR=1 FL=1